MKKIFKIILTSLLLIFSSYENTSFAVKNIKSNLFNKNDVDYQQQIASAHKKNKNRSGKKKKFKKNAKTWIKYKYPYLETNCEECKKLDGFIQPNKIDLEIYNMMGVMPGRKLTRKSFKI